MFSLKLLVTSILLGIVSLFVIYCMAYTIITEWRKRRYGCERCSYNKITYKGGHACTCCAASCGNDLGNVCPAWRYQCPAAKTKLYYPPEGFFKGRNK